MASRRAHGRAPQGRNNPPRDNGIMTRDVVNDDVDDDNDEHDKLLPDGDAKERQETKSTAISEEPDDAASAASSGGVVGDSGSAGGSDKKRKEDEDEEDEDYLDNPSNTPEADRLRRQYLRSCWTHQIVSTIHEFIHIGKTAVRNITNVREWNRRMVFYDCSIARKERRKRIYWQNASTGQLVFEYTVVFACILLMAGMWALNYLHFRAPDYLWYHTLGWPTHGKGDGTAVLPNAEACVLVPTSTYQDARFHSYLYRQFQNQDFQHKKLFIYHHLDTSAGADNEISAFWAEVAGKDERIRFESTNEIFAEEDQHGFFSNLYSDVPKLSEGGKRQRMVEWAMGWRERPTEPRNNDGMHLESCQLLAWWSPENIYSYTYLTKMAAMLKKDTKTWSAYLGEFPELSVREHSFLSTAADQQTAAAAESQKDVVKSIRAYDALESQRTTTWNYGVDSVGSSSAGCSGSFWSTVMRSRAFVPIRGTHEVKEHMDNDRNFMKRGRIEYPSVPNPDPYICASLQRVADVRAHFQDMRSSEMSSVADDDYMLKMQQRRGKDGGNGGGIVSEKGGQSNNWIENLADRVVGENNFLFGISDDTRNKIKDNVKSVQDVAGRMNQEDWHDLLVHSSQGQKDAVLVAEHAWTSASQLMNLIGLSTSDQTHWKQRAASGDENCSNGDKDANEADGSSKEAFIKKESEAEARRITAEHEEKRFWAMKVNFVGNAEDVATERYEYLLDPRRFGMRDFSSRDLSEICAHYPSKAVRKIFQCGGK